MPIMTAFDTPGPSAIMLYPDTCGDPGVKSYLLGNIFGVYLYGALTVQLYRYYIAFPKDPKPFKIVVYIVFVTETICTVVLIYVLCAISGKTGLGSCSMSYDRQAVVTLAVCGGIVALLTQSMYAYRIQIITNLKYISRVIVVVMVSQTFAIAITSGLKTTGFKFVVVWASMSLFVDVTITSVLVWFLKKDEIYCKQLERKISQLVYLIIGTGFLTAATNLCILVLILRLNSYSIGLLIVLSKLYANSMMVLVNSRIPSARSEINHCATLDIITVHLSTFRATSQVATDAEDGYREISVDPEAHSIGLSAREGEDTPNNNDLGSLTV